ncbi:hypothetical protein BDM02DRAFT_3112824, partial [Thelephora ganbajun]
TRRPKPSYRYSRAGRHGRSSRLAPTLFFSGRFIEIRHVETGRLVQSISGNDMQ